MGKNAKRERERIAKLNEERQRALELPHPEESLLSQASLDPLRRRGVDIQDEPGFVSHHVAYPSGYAVVLPEEAGGNQFPGPEGISYFKRSDGTEGITRTPSVKLWKVAGGWAVEVGEYAPGRGPGDFTETFETEEAAIDAVLNYFFDPEHPEFRAALAAYLRWART